MKKFRNDDEGVLHTMVRDVVPDGAGTMKERFVFKDQKSTFSCVAASEK